MIYSKAFENLPTPAKDAVYRKLYNVLAGTVQGETFARLQPEDRLAAFEILRDTKTDLPYYWNVPVDK